MSRNVVLGLIIVAIVLGIASAIVLLQRQEEINAPTESNPTMTPVITATPTESSPEANFQETKSAHFTSSSPRNNERLTTIPREIKLNFDFVLANNSSIAITKDNQPLEVVRPTFAANKLSMTVPLPNTATSGNYKVDYNACWPDRTCHPGSFGFVVNP